MYRQYENPRSLEHELAELKEQLKHTSDEDEIIAIKESIAELEERINFAWQDEEYDECYEDDYRDYSPSCPWNAPGMRVSDFIGGVSYF